MESAAGGVEEVENNGDGIRAVDNGRWRGGFPMLDRLILGRESVKRERCPLELREALLGKLFRVMR